MTPAELACKWYGHKAIRLEVRTPKLWTNPDDPKFTVRVTCAACCYQNDHELEGGLVHYLCEEYEHAEGNIRLA